MSVMNEYTYQHIKKNKRYTISILAAVMIASALLCSLCIFLYSIWSAKVAATIKQGGDWHGELWKAIEGEKLGTITENPEIEEVMIKGEWITAKLPDTKRPYLLMRDADTAFWKDMSLKETLLEGRLPEAEGEIVVSKLFFSDNPTYKIGDQLSLPVGQRVLGDEVLDTQGNKREGETFRSNETRNYTIVGKLDVSGSSAYPGYIAMGYLERSKIQPKDGLTVYMRLVHPRKIYEVLPKVAAVAGLEEDEYGTYGEKYNTPLLMLYGISDKNGETAQILVLAAMAVILVLLVMGAFVLIIYNAFELSANSRIKELSILKSLGATPRQIKYSVLYEGGLLWLIQLPIGMIIGHLFTYIVFKKVNEILRLSEGYQNMQVSFSAVVIVVSAMISLLTVLISAYIPARKMARLSAIEGIRQSNTKIKLKRQKKHLLIRRLFGTEGELAIAQFSANKKSMRSAVLSLAMCFVLIAGYLNVISIFNMAKNKEMELPEYDMTVTLNMIDEPSQEMTGQMISQPEIQKAVVKRQVRTATYVTTDQESDEFKKLGGFENIDMRYNVLKRDNDYRIIVNLVGLSETSFKNYCEAVGTNVQDYSRQDEIQGILYDSTYHISEHSNQGVKIPLLNLKQGSQLQITEKSEDDYTGSYEFQAHIGAVTSILPGELNAGRYSVAYIVPMTTYEKITAQFNPERQMEYSHMTIDLLVGDQGGAKAKERLNQIAGSYLGTADFEIWSLMEEKQNDALREKAIHLGVIAIAVMIGCIGIFNAFATVSNNLRLRQREFAMLQSVGLTPRELSKLLTLEGVFFAITPILGGIPVILLISWWMLKLTYCKWGEFIVNMPLVTEMIYAVLIMGAIFVAYWICSISIKKNNVIETIRNEIV